MLRPLGATGAAVGTTACCADAFGAALAFTFGAWPPGGSAVVVALGITLGAGWAGAGLDTGVSPFDKSASDRIIENDFS